MVSSDRHEGAMQHDSKRHDVQTRVEGLLKRLNSDEGYHRSGSLRTDQAHAERTPSPIAYERSGMDRKDTREDSAKPQYKHNIQYSNSGPDDYSRSTRPSVRSERPESRSRNYNVGRNSTQRLNSTDTARSAFSGCVTPQHQRSTSRRCDPNLPCKDDYRRSRSPMYAESRSPGQNSNGTAQYTRGSRPITSSAGEYPAKNSEIPIQATVIATPAQYAPNAQVTQSEAHANPNTLGDRGRRYDVTVHRNDKPRKYDVTVNPAKGDEAVKTLPSTSAHSPTPSGERKRSASPSFWYTLFGYESKNEDEETKTPSQQRVSQRQEQQSPRYGSFGPGRVRVEEYDYKSNGRSLSPVSRAEAPRGGSRSYHSEYDHYRSISPAPRERNMRGRSPSVRGREDYSYEYDRRESTSRPRSQTPSVYHREYPQRARPSSVGGRRVDYSYEYDRRESISRPRSQTPSVYHREHPQRIANPYVQDLEYEYDYEYTRAVSPASRGYSRSPSREPHYRNDSGGYALRKPIRVIETQEYSDARERGRNRAPRPQNRQEYLDTYEYEYNYAYNNPAAVATEIPLVYAYEPHTTSRVPQESVLAPRPAPRNDNGFNTTRVKEWELKDEWRVDERGMYARETPNYGKTEPRLEEVVDDTWGEWRKSVLSAFCLQDEEFSPRLERNETRSEGRGSARGRSASRPRHYREPSRSKSPCTREPNMKKERDAKHRYVRNQF